MVKLFGYFTRPKKERKKLKKERAAFESERNAFRAQRPQAEKEDEEVREKQITQNAQKSKELRQTGRQEGRKYGEELFNRNVQGLTPEQRRNSEFESEKRINRDLHAKEKKLLGEQGKRNIGNRSGVAFAQQQELRRDADEAKGQAKRDLENLNADLALKKQAAMFNVEQGEGAQSQLDRQLAADELDLNRERKRARHLEDDYRNYFMTRL